jgi:hypothetical protein
MEIMIRGLIGLSALAFALAAARCLVFPNSILGTPPEAFPRACIDLTLLAIASSVALRQDSSIGSGSPYPACSRRLASGGATRVSGLFVSPLAT